TRPRHLSDRLLGRDPVESDPDKSGSRWAAVQSMVAVEVDRPRQIPNRAHDPVRRRDRASVVAEREVYVTHPILPRTLHIRTSAIDREDRLHSQAPESLEPLLAFRSRARI